ncbi:hypothetical protein AcW1_009206 [Taiwanofungus camphoratus]|nr:hypothetical protein AcW1_009206 [Antrodia cinnamomea]
MEGDEGQDRYGRLTGDISFRCPLASYVGSGFFRLYWLLFCPYCCCSLFPPCLSIFTGMYINLIPTGVISAAMPSRCLLDTTTGFCADYTDSLSPAFKIVLVLHCCHIEFCSQNQWSQNPFLSTGHSAQHGCPKRPFSIEKKTPYISRTESASSRWTRCGPRRRVVSSAIFVA